MFAACKVPLHERRCDTSVSGVTGNIEANSLSAVTLSLSLPLYDIIGLYVLPVSNSYTPSKQPMCV